MFIYLWKKFIFTFVFIVIFNFFLPNYIASQQRSSKIIFIWFFHFITLTVFLEYHQLFYTYSFIQPSHTFHSFLMDSDPFSYETDSFFSIRPLLFTHCSLTCLVLVHYSYSASYLITFQFRSDIKSIVFLIIEI